MKTLKRVALVNERLTSFYDAEMRDNEDGTFEVVSGAWGSVRKDGTDLGSHYAKVVFTELGINTIAPKGWSTRKTASYHTGAGQMLQLTGAQRDDLAAAITGTKGGS